MEIEWAITDTLRPCESLGRIFSRESYYRALYFGERKKEWQLACLLFWNLKRHQLLLLGLFFWPYFLGPKAMALLALW